VLKIKYDVESLAQRQHEIDQLITNQTVQIKDVNELIDQDEECENYFPIANEYSLQEFEQKLITSKIFKSSAVS